MGSMKVPLFSSLTDTELKLITHSAYEDTAAAGEMIVRRGEPSREFYVILEGTANVQLAEEHCSLVYCHSQRTIVNHQLGRNKAQDESIVRKVS